MLAQLWNTVVLRRQDLKPQSSPRPTLAFCRRKKQTQRGKVTCSRLHDWPGARIELEPLSLGLFAFQFLGLNPMGVDHGF